MASAHAVLLVVGLCAAFGFVPVFIFCVIQSLRLPWHVRWDVEQPGVFQLTNRPLSYPDTLDAKGVEIRKSALAGVRIAFALFVTMVAAFAINGILAT